MSVNISENLGEITSDINNPIVVDCNSSEESADNISDIINNNDIIEIATPLVAELTPEIRFLKLISTIIEVLISENKLEFSHLSNHYFISRYEADYSSLYLDMKSKLTLILKNDILLKEFDEYRNFFVDFENKEINLINSIKKFENLTSLVNSKLSIIKQLEEKSSILDDKLRLLSIDISVKELTLIKCREQVEMTNRESILNEDQRNNISFLRNFVFLDYFGILIYSLFTSIAQIFQEKSKKVNRLAKDVVSSRINQSAVNTKSNPVKSELSSSKTKMSLIDKIRSQRKAK